MKLSVIIISYNVKYFLEQCLCSVKKALAIYSAGETEVFVVDNNSSDDSLAYLFPRFPFVQFIANKENAGFASANNQALKLAKGEYVLFLNPDTILPEDAFTSCIRFMETHPDAGACGVCMIDGSGKFLPESKRGFPSPWASFCKMSGLTALFPRSKWLARYYLGHLPASSSQEADALSGACMLVKKEVLDKTGGFDEQFFMYAEDIDLSYRIQQAGYKNYYFAGCTIIHFKGESTRRDIRYTRLFYKAMIQFVHKYYRGRTSFIYVELLKSAIWMRSLLAAIMPVAKRPLQQVFETFVTGDAAEVKHITHLVTIAANRKTVPSPNKAQEMIWCEGPACSFKMIIDVFPENALLKKIHAAGSGSIVGSHLKKDRGEIIVI